MGSAMKENSSQFFSENLRWVSDLKGFERGTIVL